MSNQRRTHALSRSSAAKDTIRNELDRGIIERLQLDYYPDQKLSYLGLPGDQLLDILSWRELLRRCTAVEDTAASEMLELNIMKHHLEGLVDVVYGDINDLLGTAAGRSQLCWPYEVVNLDYAGGLIQARGDGTSHKLDALKGLFAAQKNHAFVLLLTLNLRDNDQGEFDKLVDQQEADLSIAGLAGVPNTLEAHRRLGHAGLLKVYVPIFILNEARDFEIAFVPPILYRGTRTMIHFAARCLPQCRSSAGRMVTTGDRIEAINMPLVVAREGDDMRAVDLGHIEVVL